MAKNGKLLESTFLGFHLASPVIIASGFLSNDMRRIHRAATNGAGGVSTKLALPRVPFKAQSSIVLLEKGTGIVASGDKRLTGDEACRLIEQAKRETTMMIIANMGSTSGDIGEWRELGARLASAGADALELDMSCPNFDVRPNASPDDTPPKGCIAQYPEVARAITRAVKDAAGISVIPKLTLKVNDIGEVARACAEGGADAICAINAPPAAPPLDLKTGSPKYLAMATHAHGGQAGQSIFPMACRAVADVATAARIPVIGCGGVATWRQAVEMMMWGASAVQVFTSVALYGFEVVEKINSGIQRFMEEQGYSSIQDFRGKALQFLASPPNIEYRNVRFQVDQERCNLCGRCLTPGHCLALSASDGKLILDNSECINCGICVQLCARGAIMAKPLEAGVGTA